MLTTRFTELVGCSAPIQAAPVATEPELAAAVSEAGGLGMLPMGQAGLTPETLAGLLRALQQQTHRPVGVNFIISPRFEANRAFWLSRIEQAAQAVRVVEFFWAVPDRELVALAHRSGALVAWQVGSGDAAVAAAEAGCDFIVAQGIEAGGHVRGRLGLLPLLAEVVPRVALPVVAAGGIATGRAVAAALAAGAEGVRVGTRFLVAAEASTHPTYVDHLLQAHGEDTEYTEVFGVGWPDAPHRVLRSCIAAAAAFPNDIVGEGLSLEGQRYPWRRYQTGIASRSTTGAIEAMPLWAGEGVGAVTQVQPAATILAELVTVAEHCLRRASSLLGP